LKPKTVTTSVSCTTSAEVFDILMCFQPI